MTHELNGALTPEKMIETMTAGHDLPEAMIAQINSLFTEAVIPILGPDWVRLNDNTGTVSIGDIKAWIKRARVSELRSPIISAGVKAYYLLTWGQGVTITAPDEDINEVIQQWLALNQNTFTSHAKQQEEEKRLRVDGNLFTWLHTDPVSGIVLTRSIDPLEIVDIICNPDDKATPWYYVRNWTDSKSQPQTAAYPDIDYNPKDKPKTLPNTTIKIFWDKPVLHTAVNRPVKSTFGAPEFLASIPWAKAYERFLEHRATLYAAFAAFALLLKVRADKIAAAKVKLTRTLPGDTSGESNISNVKGSTAFIDDNASLEAVNTKGATTAPSEGIQFLEMVIMDFLLPPHIFGKAEGGGLGDSNRNQVLNLAITSRRLLWESIYNRLFRYIKLWAVKAPQGQLKGLGAVETVEVNGSVIETVEWSGDINPAVIMAWPPLKERDTAAAISALIDVATLKGSPAAGTLTPAVFIGEVARLLDIDIDPADIPDEWPLTAVAMESWVDELEMKLKGVG